MGNGAKSGVCQDILRPARVLEQAKIADLMEVNRRGLGKLAAGEHDAEATLSCPCAS